MELIDTHCHIDVEEFDADRTAVLERARSAGVSTLVVPAIHARGLSGLLSLCGSNPQLKAAVGLHPVFLEQHRQEHLERLPAVIASARPLAVGEIGLDYFVAELDRARQQQLFEAQLRLAREAALPVLLHVRKAHDQTLATLRRIRVRGGIVHAFNGSLQQAMRYLDLGFRLGFGGMITYERSRKIRGLARVLPLEAIVLETDAPDMVPFRHHGQRNAPEYLPEILMALAEIREEAPERLAAVTTANARAVLPGL